MAHWFLFLLIFRPETNITFCSASVFLNQDQQSSNKSKPSLDLSKDPEDLIQDLSLLLQSNSEKSIKSWIENVCDPAFIKRIESDANNGHDDNPKEIDRLLRVLETATKLPSQNANQVFIELTNCKLLFENQYRERIFWQACEQLRNPSPEVLDALQAARGKQSWDFVGALAKMRTKTSCDRLMLVYGSYKTDDTQEKALLFSHYLIEVRDNPNIVWLYKAILDSEAKDSTIMFYDVETETCKTTTLRTVIIQSLFDAPRPYWYHHTQRIPLPRHQAPSKTIEELLLLAKYLYKTELTFEAKSSINNCAKELSIILDLRNSGSLKRIESAIASLDNKNYVAREEASTSLMKYGELAGPAMRHALRQSDSNETRRRLEQLVARISSADKDKEIEQRIVALASPDWRTREIASYRLQRLGEYAGPALYNSLRSAKSASLRARIHRLLDELDR